MGTSWTSAGGSLNVPKAAGLERAGVVAKGAVRSMGGRGWSDCEDCQNTESRKEPHTWALGLSEREHFALRDLEVQHQV